MVYSTRNSFYLRISKTVVLPLYVYLDERHITWMSDTVLQHVLSDLRPHILNKLRAESELVLGNTATQRKGSVDTHRGDTYQLCYFLSKTEPHSVLIKSRTFTLAPVTKPKPLAKKAKPSKRKGATPESPPVQRKKRKTKRKDSEPAMVTSEDEAEARESLNESDDEYLPDNAAANTDIDIPEDIMEVDILEEEKPKPILGLTYKGFNLYGHCLCVVVEPWPSLRATIVPTIFSGHKYKSPERSSANAKVQEPLFLPEEPEDNEPDPPELTARDDHVQINKAYLEHILKDGPAADEDDVINLEDEDSDDDMNGMMEFSQVLYTMGELRNGGIDDDDAGESIFFGDADENKEL